MGMSVTEFTERAIIYVLRFPCELNEFGEINVTEKRRTSASKKYIKKHGGGLSVGLLIPALEALEASQGGEACLQRSAPINSARRGRVDLWREGRGSVRGPILS